MLSKPSITSSEFVASMKQVVQSDPVTVTLSDDLVVTAQLMPLPSAEYVLHFDFKEYSGSYRSTETGELKYRGFNMMNFYRQIEENVIDVRAVLAELLAVLAAPKRAA